MFVGYVQVWCTYVDLYQYTTNIDVVLYLFCRTPSLHVLICLIKMYWIENPDVNVVYRPITFTLIKVVKHSVLNELNHEVSVLDNRLTS